MRRDTPLNCRLLPSRYALQLIENKKSLPVSREMWDFHYPSIICGRVSNGFVKYKIGIWQIEPSGSVVFGCFPVGKADLQILFYNDLDGWSVNFIKIVCLTIHLRELRGWLVRLKIWMVGDTSLMRKSSFCFTDWVFAFCRWETSDYTHDLFKLL